MSKDITNIEEVTDIFCNFLMNNECDIFQVLQDENLTISQEDLDNAKIYCITTNISGYMPDNTPIYTNNKKSAIQSIEYELRKTFELLDEDNKEDHSKFMQYAEEFKNDVNPNIKDPIDALVIFFIEQIKNSKKDSFCVNFGGYNHTCTTISMSQALADANLDIAFHDKGL